MSLASWLGIRSKGKNPQQRTPTSTQRKPTIELLEDRLAPAIKVAVVSSGLGLPADKGFVATAAQLNDDTFFDFDAAVVNPAEVDSVAKLNNYDVVVIGNNGDGGQSAGDRFELFDDALATWVSSGGGVVATGFTVFGDGTPDESGIDLAVPVNTSGAQGIISNGSVQITDGSHPITAGVTNYSILPLSHVEYPQLGIDPGASILATTSNGNHPAVVAGMIGSGRGVYLGSIFVGGDYNTDYLRSGSPDRLLEQAVAWAQGVDNTPPQVAAVSRTDANPINASQVHFQVTFTEAVTGVDASDFSLTTSGVSGAAIESVTGSDSVYQVTVSTGSGSGIIRLDVEDDDSIIDAASNPLGGAGLGNGAFTTGEEYTIDRNLPALIRVAVVSTSGLADDSGFFATAAQLNDSSVFNFDAMVVNPSDVDTLPELSNYDVVVIGNNGGGGPTLGDQFQVFDDALAAWVNAGGGVVATGWTVFGHDTSNPGPESGIDDVVPVDTSAAHSSVNSGTVDITDSTHPITMGVSSYPIAPGFVEYSQGGVQGSVLAETSNGSRPVVVAGSHGFGRGVYLGSIYVGSLLDYNTANLRSGNPDRLLEQAVVWAANADPSRPSIDGTSGNDKFLIQLNAANNSLLEVRDGIGDLLAQYARSAITLLTVNGNGGDDTVTVDFSNGFFDTPIDFDGGPNGGNGDLLSVVGDGPFAQVTHSFINQEAGSIEISGGLVIEYGSVEHVMDNLNANDRVFNHAADAETINLIAGGALDNRIESTQGASIDFGNPNTSLIINAETGGSNADTIHLQGLSADFDVDLTMNGNVILTTSVVIKGNDIDFNAAIDLGSNTLTINTSSTDSTANGIISGAGSLIKGGPGVLTMAAAGNNYSGTTTITQGTIQLTGTLVGDGGDVILAGNNTVLTGNSSGSTHAGSISDRRISVPAGVSGVLIEDLLSVTNADGAAIEVAGSATIMNNNINGSAVGISVTGAIDMSDNDIVNNNTGVEVTGGGIINLLSDNKISGGAVGLIVDGLSSRIAGNTLGDTVFTGLSGYYVQLLNGAHQGPELIDGSNATYDGIRGTALVANTGLLNAWEQKVLHFPDDDRTGLIVLQTRYAYTDPDSGNLLVVGTNARDNILVRTSRSNRVTVTMNRIVIPNPDGGRTFDLSGGGKRVIVFGLDGHDVIQTPGAIPAEVYGGRGNDRITGGVGNDVLRGEEGRDTLAGGSGDDVLIGGFGLDLLSGGSGDDIVIGNHVLRSYTDLQADLAQWSANAASTALMATLFAAQQDDGQQDRLLGGHGSDVFVNPASFLKDRVVDKRSSQRDAEMTS